MPTATTEHQRPRPLRLDTPAQLRLWSDRCRAAGLRVGLVPTMGALHAGHTSLIRRGRQECDRLVVSVFVNPRQFGPGEDLACYPRTLDADLILLAREGVDAVFVPAASAMYAADAATEVRVTGTITSWLEATCRPGHLEGVALVVAKLLIACRPARAYFGRKDAQQCALVRRVAADLDTGAEIVLCPVVRDHDGLALSSRNVHLDPEQRMRARGLPAGLAAAAQLFAAGERSAPALCARARAEMERRGVTVDYVAAVDASSFAPVDVVAPGCEIVVAGRIATIRLIDVIRLGLDPAPEVAAGGDAEVPAPVGLQGTD